MGARFAKIKRLSTGKVKNQPGQNPFESLPRDLTWNIFDYVPESVLALRKVSMEYLFNF